MPSSSKTPLILAGTLTGGLALAFIAWAAWPEPEPEDPDLIEDNDTGLSRDETEEMMRTIGYVQ